MPGRDHFSRLHDDLVAGILVLLLPKQVGRARLVCRLWHALTTYHHFALTSFSLSRHAGGRPVAGFFPDVQERFPNFHLKREKECFPKCYFPLHSDAETEKGLVAPDLSLFPFPNTSTNPLSIRVTSSCNGLLTLLCGWTYYVCNPLTSGLFAHDLTIAFEPTRSCHYKVVALGHRCSIHVFSSETRSWRMAVDWDHSAGLFEGLRSFRGVFWNGSIIWNLGHSLRRFVIEGEYLTNLPTPPKKKG